MVDGAGLLFSVKLLLAHTLGTSEPLELQTWLATDRAEVVVRCPSGSAFAADHEEKGTP